MAKASHVDEDLFSLLSNLAAIRERHPNDQHTIFLDAYTKLLQRVASHWQRYAAKFGGEL